MDKNPIPNAARWTVTAIGAVIVAVGSYITVTAYNFWLRWSAIAMDEGAGKMMLFGALIIAGGAYVCILAWNRPKLQ